MAGGVPSDGSDPGKRRASGGCCGGFVRGKKAVDVRTCGSLGLGRQGRDRFGL